MPESSPGARDPQRLLLDNLEVVERAIAFTCRRNGLIGADAEDFASIVKLKLIENDYAVLRSFGGRSSFSTYITVVVQRTLLDVRVNQWGKWHPSAHAKRTGDLAVALEKLLYRDGRTIDEALVSLSASFANVTRESIEAIARELPQRNPRRRLVAIDEVPDLPASPADTAEQAALERDRDAMSARVSEAVRAFILGLSADDQLILQLRFEEQMTVAQIARSMRIEQKLLYRRIERHMRELREHLQNAGIDADEALDLIGHDVALDFGLRNHDVSPSKTFDDAGRAVQEELRG